MSDSQMAWSAGVACNKQIIHERAAYFRQEMISRHAIPASDTGREAQALDGDVMANPDLQTQVITVTSNRAY